MIRSTAAALLPFAALLAVSSPSAAQDDQFSSIADQRVLDSAYDYELWVAEPESATGWYIILEYEDGYLDVLGPHATKSDAQKWVDFTNKHTTQLIRQGKAPRISYQERSKEPNWQYYGTFPTLADAEDEAEWFEDFGLLTDIRRVSTLQKVLRLQ